MVFVPKLLAVCPTLVFVLFGYCGRIKGEGKDLQSPGSFKDFETKFSQKPERMRLADNIKIGWEDVDVLHVAKDRAKWPAVVNTVMKGLVP
jgi:hypothetical protein